MKLSGTRSKTKMLKSIRNNEVAKLILLAVVVISISYGGWAGMRLILATEHPVLVVISGSMVPTLNVGDLIVIKGEPAENIKIGTIIVFHSPRDYDTLVVHRVVDKQNSDSRIYFKTKGDFNRYVDDWTVPAEKVVGSFSARIPYIGIIIMKLREPAGTAFIVSLIIILIAYEAYSSHKKTKTKISGTESKIRASRKR